MVDQKPRHQSLVSVFYMKTSQTLTPNISKRFQTYRIDSHTRGLSPELGGPPNPGGLLFLTVVVMVLNVHSYRDFKIGHYGRLGRLDAYTGGLGP